MSTALISPESLARRIQKALRAEGGRVVLAANIGAFVHGHTIRFIHSDDGGSELTRLEIHFSPNVAAEIKLRTTRTPLSSGAKSRLKGVITALANQRFRGDFPFRALVAKPACTIATANEPAGTMAAAV